MKSLLLVLLGCVLMGMGVQAAELDSGVEAVPGTPTHHEWDRYPWSITQNFDPTTVDAGTFTCGNTVYNYITDCWAMRRFYFADDGIDVPFTVQSVDWFSRRFVALGDSVPGPYSVTMYAYSIPTGAPLLFANFTELANTVIPVDPSFNPPAGSFGVPHNTLIDAVYNDTVNQDMIIAFFSPTTYYMVPRVRFALSGHNTGEFWPSYYAFADCGYAEPVTPEELGSPGASQLVLVVNGDVWEPGVTGACCDPATGGCTLVPQDQCLPPLVWNGATTCDPNPCPPPVPAQNATWGSIKQSYR